MHIWVDADACPQVIKDILFRAAERCRIRLTSVANHYRGFVGGVGWDAFILGAARVLDSRVWSVT